MFKTEYKNTSPVPVSKLPRRGRCAPNIKRITFDECFCNPTILHPLYFTVAPRAVTYSLRKFCFCKRTCQSEKGVCALAAKHPDFCTQGSVSMSALQFIAGCPPPILNSDDSNVDVRAVCCRWNQLLSLRGNS